MHIYVFTNLLMFYFWIKLTMKMPIYLTGKGRDTRELVVLGRCAASSTSDNAGVGYVGREDGVR